jgi:hypothetical protein
MDLGRIVEELESAEAGDMQHYASKMLRETVLPPLPSAGGKLRKCHF